MYKKGAAAPFFVSELCIRLEYTENHIYDFPYMIITPLQFYKCLADETRLSCVLLISAEEELCVCELTESIDASQPKISRHLAQLRECGLLSDRRVGQWIFYRINPELPSWAKEVLASTLKGNQELLSPLCCRLNGMSKRPERGVECC